MRQQFQTRLIKAATANGFAEDWVKTVFLPNASGPIDFDDKFPKPSGLLDLTNIFDDGMDYSNVKIIRKRVDRSDSESSIPHPVQVKPSSDNLISAEEETVVVLQQEVKEMTNSSVVTESTTLNVVRGPKTTGIKKTPDQDNPEDENVVPQPPLKKLTISVNAVPSSVY